MAESWLNGNKNKVSFFTLKSYVVNLLDRLGLSGYQETALSEGQWSYALRFHRGQQVLVEFGKIQTKILKDIGIKQEVFYADFQWDSLLKAVKKSTVSYKELNKYPSIRRDLALVIANSVKFSDIVKIARKTDKKLLKDCLLYTSPSPRDRTRSRMPSSA